MSKRRESTNRKTKADDKKPGGRSRLSAVERRRRKGEADRRYYERYRSGCAVTAYLDTPEMKEALIEKLRPLGLSVSHAIWQLVKMVIEGRIVFVVTPKEPK
jgi:hypothetical protein